ncbi:MAG: DUF1236 domain-containing protein [Mesorhizobium sp.]|nr:DUF1236 domain-containing protein [Mesorhizobium sp.]MCO5163232.1 DUF1236 domain-containing protein [Mesorhizobium sp.]
MLKKLIFATALAGSFAATAIAQEAPSQTTEEVKNQKFETGAGAVTGAAAGAVVGGPVGAVVGGVAGAAIGAATSVPEPAREYVVANPVEPVVIEEKVAVGTVIPQTVVIHEIPDAPEFGYVYVDSGPVVVKKQTREVVFING